MRARWRNDINAIQPQLDVANRRVHRLRGRWKLVNLQIDMLADATTRCDSKGLGEMGEGGSKSRIAARSIEVKHDGIVGYCTAHQSNVGQQSTLMPTLY